MRRVTTANGRRVYEGAIGRSNGTGTLPVVREGLRRFLGGTGRLLMTSGVLILLFVAYGLWGTGFFTARSQNALEDDFELAKAAYGQTTSSHAATTTSAPTEPTGSTPPTTATPGGAINIALPVIAAGDPIGKIRIPKIGIDWTFVQGTTRDDLKKGPGHYQSTPYPGQTGNAAIAGHRTTWGQPFNRVDELQPGDPIEIETFWGNFTYQVECTIIVKPGDTWVAGAPISNCTQGAFIDPATPQLTLSSCNPKFSARERIIVKAALRGEDSDVPAVFDPSQLPDRDRVPGAIPGEGPDLSGSLDDSELSEGLAGDPASRGPALVWSVFAAVAGLLWWWGYRHWRHWVTWLVGVAPFGALLSGAFFYIERMLPAGY